MEMYIGAIIQALCVSAVKSIQRDLKIVLKQ